MKFLKVNKNLVAIAVTFVFLIWLTMSLDKEAVVKLLNNLSPIWIIVGSFFYCCVYLARVSRWKTLLPLSSNSFKDMLAITGIHNLAVRIFPNPTGELVFLHQAKQKNIPYPDSLAALVINRALDFISIGVFFLTGVIPFIQNLTWPIFFFLFLSIFFVSAGVGFIVFISMAPKTAQKIINRISFFFLAAGFQKTIEQKTGQFLNAFLRLKNRKIYFKATIFSFAVWACMFFAYFFFLNGFGINLELSALLAGGTIQIFANTIPNIGGLGVMEAGWTAGLSLANVEKSTAVAGALAVDLMTLIGTVIFGFIGFLMQRGNFFINYKKRFKSSK